MFPIPCPFDMGKETKSEFSPPRNGIEKAWRELTADKEQYGIYDKMSSTAVEKLREEIRKGKPPKEGMEFIFGYLKAVEDFQSRGEKLP